MKRPEWCCRRQPAPSSPPEASAGPLHNTQQSQQKGVEHIYHLSIYLWPTVNECSDPGWDLSGRRGKGWWWQQSRAEKCCWEAAPLSSSPLGNTGLKQDFKNSFNWTPQNIAHCIASKGNMPFSWPSDGIAVPPSVGISLELTPVTWFEQCARFGLCSFACIFSWRACPEPVVACVFVASEMRAVATFCPLLSRSKP